METVCSIRLIFKVTIEVVNSALLAVNEIHPFSIIGVTMAKKRKVKKKKLQEFDGHQCRRVFFFLNRFDAE